MCATVPPTDSHVCLPFTCRACKSHSQLTCLNLTAVGSVTPAGLATSFSHLPHLKHALLAAMTDLVDEAVVAALLALPALEVLELEDCPRIMQVWAVCEKRSHLGGDGRLQHCWAGASSAKRVRCSLKCDAGNALRRCRVLQH